MLRSVRAILRPSRSCPVVRPTTPASFSIVMFSRSSATTTKAKLAASNTKHQPRP
jgi:hypothetical protein